MEIEKAWHNETFGEMGLLGRDNKSEVILSKFLLPVLEKLNPNLPKSAYREAYLKIAQRDADKKLDKINKEKYELIKSGVQVSYTDNKGKLNKKTLRVLDFDNLENNHFLAVRQLEVTVSLLKKT